jgi:hypothetical protein
LSLIGNLAHHIKDFRNSSFLKDSGTHNLIEIMSNFEGIRFNTLACITILKCTAGGNVDLLDSFVAAGVIEKIVELLDKHKSLFHSI